MDEKDKDALDEMEARVERLAERVIVPETLAPTSSLELFGQRLQARALPMKFTKRLHQQSRLLWMEVSEILAVRNAPDEEKLAVLVKHPDVDTHAAEALVKCLLIITEFYKIPGITAEMIEEQYTVSQMLQVVGFQLALNEGDDFLLQPLRLTLAVMGSIPVIASLIRVPDSQASPSTTPGPKPGASPSTS